MTCFLLQFLKIEAPFLSVQTESEDIDVKIKGTELVEKGQKGKPTIPFPGHLARPGWGGVSYKGNILPHLHQSGQSVVGVFQQFGLQRCPEITNPQRNMYLAKL